MRRLIVMSTDAHEAARAVEASPVMRALTRAGFAANGTVHILLGVIVLVVAFGGEGDADQAGAFQAVAAAPLGFAVLWILAISLWSLALWHLAGGVLARRDSPDAKWSRRAVQWGKALVYLALGVVAASVALGARPDTDRTAQDVSRGVLIVPGGVYVLAAAGIGVGIAGIVIGAIGVRRGFAKEMSIPDGTLGRVVTTLGVVGYLGKGAAFVILGVLLVVAAVKVDPDAAGGLDAAITALLTLPYGPPLAVAVGGGLIVYGVFCLFRARFADL
jgi:hypothetical protein